MKDALQSAADRFGLDPVRLARVGDFLWRAFPYASLAWGLVCAVTMDRSPRSAWMVAAGALVGWGALAGLALLHRFEPERLPRLQALMVHAARFGSIAANQSLLQLTLLFSLPFYFRAAVFGPAHLGFLVVLGVASAASLWDPLSEAIFARPVVGLPLQAFACFAALNVVLPVLGMSNRWSLWASAAVTVVGMPLASLALAPRQTRARDTAIAFVAALAVPVGLALGAGRAIPAAPLRLVEAGFGTGVEERALIGPMESAQAAPEKLYCFTAIWAPAGLHDALVHVWSQDGEERDRVPQQVSGGRELGFRTWSAKSSFGSEANGRWSCRVETVSGQLLGERSFRIGP